ncbi:MAG: tRNA (guanosine(46)-N7)-methyltransferase TrmB [Bacteroidota bacterium]
MPRKKALRKDAFFIQDQALGPGTRHTGSASSFFPVEQPLTLELGCGKADFSRAMAAHYPSRNFIGIDLKPDRLWHASTKAAATGLTNVGFMCLNLLQIGDHFEKGEVAEAWITFPDPFPKNRQAKHRMVNPGFLRAYAQILAPDSILHYKTDNLPLFQYSLEVFVKEPYLSMVDLTFDLHQADSPNPDALFITDYEARFIEMGKTINYVALSLDKTRL